MTGLRDFFPSLRTREDILKEIRSDYRMNFRFESLGEEEQERFLDICSGNRGLTVLHDAYFQEIFNPDTTPERLMDLLSILLERRIVSIRSLRSNSSVILDNQSLLVLDIIVELDDGSLVNVEMQKIGYLFPGQRACCYSSDLVLRQYKRLRSEKKRDFSYRDVRPVYSVIFMETYSSEFKAFQEDYIHRFSQTSDTGLILPLLQNYIFIPLDIFRRIIHNKGVKSLSRLEAWLLFLSSDRPDDICTLIEEYPEFRPIYEQIFEICSNTGRMMEMFSRELQMMDHNTVRLMIDEMKDELSNLERELKSRDEELKSRDEELKSRDEELKSRDEELKVRDEELKDRDEKLKATQAEIERLRKLLADSQKTDD